MTNSHRAHEPAPAHPPTGAGIERINRKMSIALTITNLAENWGYPSTDSAQIAKQRANLFRDLYAWILDIPEVPDVPDVPDLSHQRSTVRTSCAADPDAKPGVSPTPSSPNSTGPVQ